MKDINLDEKEKGKLDIEKQKVIDEAQLNFKIINSKFSDRIKVGSEYYLCIDENGDNFIALKHNFNDNNSIIIGCYKLNEDLTWITIE